MLGLLYVVPKAVAFLVGALAFVIIWGIEYVRYLNVPAAPKVSESEQMERMADKLSQQVRNAALQELSVQCVADRSELAIDWSSTGTSVASKPKIETLLLSPPRRLVIIGPPGSGKTVMAMNLAIALQDPATGSNIDDRVAVLFSMADWVPRKSGLADWMVKQLRQNYRMSRQDAVWLMQNHRIMPLLDGLDEISSNIDAAVEGIEDYLADGGPIVVTSREPELQKAMEKTGPLKSAVAVELRPLTIERSLGYLDPRCEPRWREVRAAVAEGGHEPLTEALSLPLTVGLMREVYRGTASRPEELVRMSTLSEIQDRLHSEFARSVFRHQREDSMGPDTGVDRDFRSGRRRRRVNLDPGDVQRWLKFLAVWLEGMRASEIALGRLPGSLRLRYRVRGRLVVGAMTSIMWTLTFLPLFTPPTSLTDLVFLVGTGIAVGSLIGSLAIPGPKSKKRMNLERIGFASGRKFLRRSAFSLVAGFAAAGFIAGMTIMLARVLSEVLDTRYTTSDGTLIESDVEINVVIDASFYRGVAVFGLMMTLVYLAFWSAAPRKEPRAENPRAALKADRNALLVRILAIVGLMGSFFSLSGGWYLAIVMAFWTSVLLAQTSTWWNFRIANAILAIEGELPWDLLGALEECHRRRLLRQDGAAYRFRHAEFQSFLLRSARAGMDSPGR